MPPAADNMAPEIDVYAVAKDLFPDMPPGFPFENFDLEELILPDGDDMGIRSDDDDVKEEDVQTESGFGSCIGAIAPGAARQQQQGICTMISNYGIAVGSQSSRTCPRHRRRSMKSSWAWCGPSPASWAPFATVSSMPDFKGSVLKQLEPSFRASWLCSWRRVKDFGCLYARRWGLYAPG